MNDLREQLAAYSHEAWSQWMRYQFDKCGRNIDFYFIPIGFVERWTRQMSTPYDQLPESEKKSDRDEADKILALLKAAR